jgi:hypothetical protein
MYSPHSYHGSSLGSNLVSKRLTTGACPPKIQRREKERKKGIRKTKAKGRRRRKT